MLPKYAQKVVDSGMAVDKYFCVSCAQHKYFNVSLSPPVCIKCGNGESLEMWEW